MTVFPGWRRHIVWRGQATLWTSTKNTSSRDGRAHLLLRSLLFAPASSVGKHIALAGNMSQVGLVRSRIGMRLMVGQTPDRGIHALVVGYSVDSSQNDSLKICADQLVVEVSL